MYELLHQFANNAKLWILGNFKKILEIHGIKNKFPVGHLKSKTLTVAPQNCKKNKSKRFHRKTYFINFKNMSTIFCPGLKGYLLTSLKVQYVTPDIPIKM